MGHIKLNKLIENDVKMTSLITNLTSWDMDLPYIIKETLKTLDDDNPFCNIISDSNKIALCNMLNSYFNTCWMHFILDELKLDKVLNYGKIEVYKVDAANGLRYATQNEVGQGIKGLIGEYIYPAGQNEYELLCLLQWSFTGNNYYFRQAGYKLSYDSDGKVVTSFYEMIQMSANKLKEMFDWVSVDDNIDKALKKINKMKKNKGYKYATYAKDEITEDITIKQLVYNICKVFPRDSTNRDYRKALALSIKANKNSCKLTPLEISFLREIYEKHALDIHRKDEPQEVNESLKKECELLLQEQFKGKINQKHFAYTIINTLRKNNYTKCSPKQYSIIEDALRIIGYIQQDDKKEQTKTEVISDSEIDMSLGYLSDAIGDGLFDD